MADDKSTLIRFLRMARIGKTIPHLSNHASAMYNVAAKIFKSAEWMADDVECGTPGAKEMFDLYCDGITALIADIRADRVRAEVRAGGIRIPPGIADDKLIEWAMGEGEEET